jgi:methyl-accepting chemotaxis protein
MSKLSPRPERLEQWLGRSSFVVTLAMLFLAVAYGGLTFRLPSEVLFSFFGVMTVTGLVAVQISESQVRRQLKSLRLLSETPRPEVALFRAAAQEVRAFPFTVMRSTVLPALGQVASTAVGWWLLADVGPVLLLRFCFICGVFMVLTSLARFIVALARSRVILNHLLETGLQFETLASNATPEPSLQSRALFFVSMTLAAPHMMLWDLVVLRGFANGEASLARGSGEWNVPVNELFSFDGTMVAVGLVTFAACLGLVFFGTRIALQPINLLGDVTRKLSAGAFELQFPVVAESEIWQASKSIYLLQQRLSSVAREVNDSSAELEVVALELSKAETHYREGASAQTNALLETSATTEELAQSARAIADTSLKVSELAQQTLKAAQQGATDSGQFVETLDGVTTQDERIAASVVRLNDRMLEIEKVVQFIESIADRSDLLALNAELEAFKVGETGRGFGLIAIEMRRLSESIVSSTQAIVRLVNEVRDATQSAVMATEAGVKAGRLGSALAKQVAAALSNIVSNAEQSATAMQAISTATVQQQVGTDQLAKSMSEVLESTKAGLQAVDLMTVEQRQLVDSCSRFTQVLSVMKA